MAALAVWIIVCLGTGLITGCGAEGDGRSAGDASTTLTILSHEEDVRIGPQYFADAKFLLFETLVWVDERGEIVPRLARSWEHSADYREWTYHLRSDVRWHDGVPVTAKDVKFTVELFAHPNILYFWNLEEVLAPDDTTVIIRRTQPTRPDRFTVYYPEHLLRDLDPEQVWEWEFWDRPVGNGPFRFSHVVPRTLWEMVANEDHYESRPAIDRVRIKLGGGNPIAELRAGNVNVATRS